jgi:hypothetical protein
MRYKEKEKRRSEGRAASFVLAVDELGPLFSSLAACGDKLGD